MGIPGRGSWEKPIGRLALTRAAAAGSELLAKRGNRSGFSRSPLTTVRHPPNSGRGSRFGLWTEVTYVERLACPQHEAPRGSSISTIWRQARTPATQFRNASRSQPAGQEL